MLDRTLGKKISIAIDANDALWACLEGAGFRPGWLSREEALDFLERQLGPFLAAQHLTLGPRQRRRLRR